MVGKQMESVESGDKLHKIISMGTRVNAERGCNWHDHRYWEFIYYIDGNGTIQAGREEFAFKPNTLICIPPRVAHIEYADVQFTNIYFLTDAIPDLSCKAYVYEDHILHEMENLLTQLRFYYHRHSRHDAEICSIIVDLIFALIRAKPLAGDTEAYVDIAANCLIANIHNSDYDVNDIYDEIPMSKNHFVTLFKKQTGYTPLQYLTQRRIDNAKKLLLSEDFHTSSVGNIATLSGFKDVYYFSRVFKKLTGLSPIQWLNERMSDEKEND